MLSEELAAARSERLKTLGEKEQLANRLQQLLEALPGGVVVLDDKETIVDSNQVAVEMLGSPLSDQTWANILKTRMQPPSDNPHERQLINGIYVSISVRPLGDGLGRIILLTDVSEMRSLQEMVSHQQRLSAMGEMVASLAHQVRTPLSSAILYASQLTRSTELTEQQSRKFANKLLERLKHLERQVNDMLVYAKDGRYEKEEFTLEVLLDKVFEAMEPYLSDTHLSFRIVNQAKTVTLLGNEDALQGILMNLLTNACQAMQGNGRLTLEARVTEEAYLTISVKDEGPGIPDNQVQSIFQPFYTTRPNGTGLGLAVADSVVRAHGGSIRCESTLGKGTEFQIQLPLPTHREFIPSGLLEQ